MRPSTLKGYRDIWKGYLRERLGKVTLRDFRTVDGERLLADIAGGKKLSRNSLRLIKSFLSWSFQTGETSGDS